jgi:hypothetical protein
MGEGTDGGFDTMKMNFWLTALLVSAGLFSVQSTPVFCEEVTLQTIIDGAKRNWDAINDLSATYVFDQYYAPMPDIDGTPLGELRNAYRFTYVLKKPLKYRLERRLLKTSKPSDEYETAIKIFDGERCLRSYPESNIKIIEPGDPELHEMDMKCFGLTVDGKPLGYYLKEIMAGKWPALTCELRGEEVISGTRCYIIGVYQNSKLSKKMWIVPEAGFCYKKIERYDESSELAGVIEQIELKQVAGVWVPLKGRSASYEKVTKRIKREIKMDVEEISLNTGLPDSWFRFDPVKGTTITSSTPGYKPPFGKTKK